jgi:hypothetical protein
MPLLLKVIFIVPLYLDERCPLATSVCPHSSLRGFNRRATATEVKLRLMSFNPIGVIKLRFCTHREAMRDQIQEYLLDDS